MFGRIQNKERETLKRREKENKKKNERVILFRQNQGFDVRNLFTCLYLLVYMFSE